MNAIAPSAALEPSTPGSSGSLNRDRRFPTRAGGRAALAALTLLLAGSGAAHGLDPHTLLTQYRHRDLQTQDGLPNSDVQAIAQTPDGFLWLGTEEGLARFDGQRFTVFDRRTVPKLPMNSVLALAVGVDGTLWVGDGRAVGYRKRPGR